MDKKAEDVVFGKDTTKKVSPIVTEQEGVNDRKIEVSESAMKDLLQRLSELETDKQRRTQAEEDIFNPLQKENREHTCRLGFYNDKIVTGYVGKENPDGTVVYIIHKIIEDGEFKGQMRGRVTLTYEDGTTENVDYLQFCKDVSCVVATIKDKKDIGRIVNQGEVSVKSWNGRALVPTSTRIMTGYKEQKFEFVVEYKGKDYKISQDVINLK